MIIHEKVSIMWEIIIIFFILFLGSFIQGSSGFGFGLVSMGILSIFLTVKDSMLIILALTVIMSLGILIKLWKYILWRDIVPILASAIVGRVLAFLFVVYFGESDFIRIWLAFVLIGMVVYLYLNRKSSDPTKHSKKRMVGLFAGGVGGFVGGVFAIGGPFFVVYFITSYQDKRYYNANLQLTFILLNVLTLFAHGLNGDLSYPFYFYFLIGIIVVWIGVNLGLRLFDRLSRKVIQNIAYTIILIAGINLFIVSAL